MKPNTLALAALGAIGFAALAADPKITSADVAHARLYLQQTENGVIGATKGLSPAQWKFKAAPDRWSIAEIVEHMVLAQDLILGPVRDQLAKAPAAGDRDIQKIDSAILNGLPDRTAKFQAPDILQPTGRWTPNVTIETLRKNFAELKHYVETAPDLRDHVIDAPPLKAVSKGAYETMDGYQWVLAAAAHTERHTKQILEVKADARFPLK